MIHLNHIHTKCCTELCSYKNLDGVSKIAFSILPCEDLVLQKPLLVLFEIPNDYQTRSGLKIYHSSPRLFRLTDGNNSSNSTNEVCIPWLNSCKHDVAVWFHTLRMLFRRPDEMPWDTPALLKCHFPLHYSASSSSGSGGGSSSIGASNQGGLSNNGDQNDSPCSQSSSSYASGGGSNPRSNVLSINNNGSAAPPQHLICGAGRLRGRRNYMEDVDFQFSSIQVNAGGVGSVALYGVLDGHGGADCGIYVADELPSKLTVELRSKRPIPEALFSSFVKTDIEFLQVASDSSAGCTATVLVWDGANNVGYVANAGDTRAVLCRGGRSVDLTVDKKATDPYEIARILREGGFVSNGRVMGSLAVSRSLGDGSLKHTLKRILVPDPEVTTFSYMDGSHDTSVVHSEACGGADEFIVLATDGLWDVMSSQAAITLIKQQMEKMQIDAGCGKSEDQIVSELNTICTNVATHAYKNLNSGDNITVMILLFSNWLRGSGTTGGAGEAAAGVGMEELGSSPLSTSQLELSQGSTGSVALVDGSQARGATHTSDTNSGRGSSPRSEGAGSRHSRTGSAGGAPRGLGSADIRYWETKVALDTQSTWESIVSEYIREPYRKLYLKPCTEQGAGKKPKQNQSEYLSAAVHGLNSEAYEAALANLSKEVNNLTLPADKVYSSKRIPANKSGARVGALHGLDVRGGDGEQQYGAGTDGGAGTSSSQKYINTADSNAGKMPPVNLASLKGLVTPTPPMSPTALAREIDDLLLSEKSDASGGRHSGSGGDKFGRPSATPKGGGGMSFFGAGAGSAPPIQGQAKASCNAKLSTVHSSSNKSVDALDPTSGTASTGADVPVSSTGPRKPTSTGGVQDDVDLAFLLDDSNF